MFVQSDWDYPALARMFGWKMGTTGCKHFFTDGTVTCPDCNRTTSYFIQRAAKYLDDHIGKVVLDKEGIFQDS